MWQWLRRIPVLLLTPIIIWLLVSRGVGSIVSEALTSEDNNSGDHTYQPVNPLFSLTANARTALSEQAAQGQHPAEAKQEALLALGQDPTSGKAAADLLTLFEHEKDLNRANQMADLAGKLWSAHTYTHSRIADYWLRQQRLDKVIPEWNILLIRNPSLQASLFPTLENIIATPDLNKLLAPYISEPPNWWNGFFAYLAKKEGNLDLLRQLYQQRLDSKVALDNQERLNYVNRLLREKLWQEAYFAWLGGLKEDQLKLSQLVYDGGFEGELSNSGFDWNLQPTKEMKIEPDITDGIQGQQALHISLHNIKPVPFQHVSQRLLLAAGDYQLKMRYRLDNLKNPKGLRWRIHCLDNPNTLLGESTALKGRSPWDTLKLNFTVPATDCQAQLLRLEADSPYIYEQIFDGNLWFDDVSIQLHKGEGQ